MSENEWKIKKTGPHCEQCNLEFQQGVAYYSALTQVLEKHIEEPGKESRLGDEFNRSDFCEACFQSARPAEVYYYWKTTLAQPETTAPRKTRTVMDVDHVLEFFKRLEGESAQQKVAFRYILALILARKKLLQTSERRTDSEGRPVQVYREKSGGGEHVVVEPELTAEEISGLSDELGVLLGMTPAKTENVAEAAESGSEGKVES